MSTETAPIAIAPPGLEGPSRSPETAIGDVRGSEGFYHYRQYSAVELAAKRSFEDVAELCLSGVLPDPEPRRPQAGDRSMPEEIALVLPSIAGFAAPLGAFRTGGLALRCGFGVVAPDPRPRAGRAACRGRPPGRGDPDGPRGDRPHPRRRIASDRTPGRSRARRQLSLDDDRGRTGARSRPGRRAVRDLDDRPRVQCVNLHSKGHRVHRREPCGGDLWGDRLALRTAARGSAEPGARHARRDRRPRAGESVGPPGDRAWRPDHGRASVTASTRPTIRGRSSCGARCEEIAAACVSRLAAAIESTVLEVLEELKPGRELFANAEFYASVLLDGCGIDREMFTPTFAVGRMVGWCAHILEQAAKNRLIRPAAIYVGPPPPEPVPG